MNIENVQRKCATEKAGIRLFASSRLRSANGEIHSFLAKFFSAPSAPLRDSSFNLSVWPKEQDPRRDAEGAERGREIHEVLTGLNTFSELRWSAKSILFILSKGLAGLRLAALGLCVKFRPHEGSEKRPFWINEPILLFFQISLKWLIINNLSRKKQVVKKRQVGNEPIF